MTKPSIHSWKSQSLLLELCNTDDGRKGGGATPRRSTRVYGITLPNTTVYYAHPNGGRVFHITRTLLYSYFVRSHFSQGHLCVRHLDAYISR